MYICVYIYIYMYIHIHIYIYIYIYVYTHMPFLGRTTIRGGSFINPRWGLVTSSVSSKNMTCKSLKWLLDHPVKSFEQQYV